MSKPTFDLGKFYSVPRGVHALYNSEDKSYCAWGAGYLAMGVDAKTYTDLHIDDNAKGKNFHSAAKDATGINMWANGGPDIMRMNDQGIEPAFFDKCNKIMVKLAIHGKSNSITKFIRRADRLRKPNPERANKMLLDYLQSNDLVEFVNVSYAPGVVEKAEALV